MNDPIEPNGPQGQPLICNQGADFVLPLPFYNSVPDLVPFVPDLTNPYDLTGYVFHCVVTESQAGRATVVVTIPNTVSGNTVTLALTNEQTAALKPGGYYYDLSGTVGGKKYYFAAGTFIVKSRKS